MTGEGGVDNPGEDSRKTAPPESFEYHEMVKYSGGYKVIISKKDNVTSPFEIKSILGDKYTRSDLTLEKHGKRCIAFCKSAKIANDLTANKELKNAGFFVYIPLYYAACAVIIFNVDTDKTEEWIKANIDTRGPRKVLRVFRLQRKTKDASGDTEWVDSTRVKVFLQGSEIPEYLYVDKYIRCPCQLYVRRFTQCNNCHKFNHTAKKCNSVKICRSCGLPAPAQENHKCEIMRCAACKGDHHTSSPTCPAKIRQHNINHIMAKEMLSWDEANKIFPVKEPKIYTYSNILSNNPFSVLTDEDEFPTLTSVTSSHQMSDLTSQDQRNRQSGPAQKRSHHEPRSNRKTTIKERKRWRHEANSELDVDMDVGDGSRSRSSSPTITDAEAQAKVEREREREILRLKYQDQLAAKRDHTTSSSEGVVSHVHQSPASLSGSAQQTFDLQQQETFFQASNKVIQLGGLSHPLPLPGGTNITVSPPDGAD